MTNVIDENWKTRDKEFETCLKTFVALCNLRRCSFSSVDWRPWPHRRGQLRRRCRTTRMSWWFVQSNVLRPMENSTSRSWKSNRLASRWQVLRKFRRLTRCFAAYFSDWSQSNPISFRHFHSLWKASELIEIQWETSWILFTTKVDKIALSFLASADNDFIYTHEIEAIAFCAFSRRQLHNMWVMETKKFSNILAWSYWKILPQHVDITSQIPLSPFAYRKIAGKIVAKISMNIFSHSLLHADPDYVYKKKLFATWKIARKTNIWHEVFNNEEGSKYLYEGWKQTLSWSCGWQKR